LGFIIQIPAVQLGLINVNWVSLNFAGFYFKNPILRFCLQLKLQFGESFSIQLLES
jgi:hypothetical protein